jgi:nitrate/nitrite transporter NarK
VLTIDEMTRRITASYLPLWTCDTEWFGVYARGVGGVVSRGDRWMARHSILAVLYVATILVLALVASEGIVDHQWRWPDAFTVVLLVVVVPVAVVGTGRRRVRRQQSVSSG